METKEEKPTGIKDPAHKAHTIAAFVILVLTTIAIGTGAWYYLSTQATDSYQSILKFKKKTPTKQTDSGNTKESVKAGTIKGTITYPSQGIPDDVMVYAEPISGGAVIAGTVNIPTATYSIEVPAGSYYIYATSARFNSGNGTEWKAYHNKFVTCGMSVDCKDTSKIVITVKAGEMITDVKVGDWYMVK